MIMPCPPHYWKAMIVPLKRGVELVDREKDRQESGTNTPTVQGVLMQNATLRASGPSRFFCSGTETGEDADKYPSEWAIALT
jgi:hypothetical protein